MEQQTRLALTLKERFFMTPHARAFFTEEEKQNQRLIAYTKLAIIGIISFFEYLDYLDGGNLQEILNSLGENALFLPVIVLQIWFSRSKYYRPFLKYFFLTFDVILVAWLIIIINPFSSAEYTQAEKLQVINDFRDQDMVQIYLLYSWVLLSYSIRLLIWFGVCVCTAWVANLLYVIQVPGAFTEENIPEALQKLPAQEISKHPMYIDVDIIGIHIFITLLLTVGFAFVIYSGKNLIMRFYKSELQRSILSRYFSPNVVEKLIDEGKEILPRKKNNAAIVFVDIVGFTPLCERISADELLTMLQEFHSMLEGLVFKHGGTMEKYIGDAMMASFGVPDEQEDAAIRAYDCARDILNQISIWSGEREARGLDPVQIGIGLSYGETITGTIGEGRNMAFVVLGRTVNLASRLQAMTRELNTKLVVSQQFFEQLTRHPDRDMISFQFDEVPPVEVRGFVQPVEIRILQE